MRPGNDDSDYVWIEGNDFCCICAWWHPRNVNVGHEPVLCPRCLLDWMDDPKLRDRDSAVTPERKKGG